MSTTSTETPLSGPIISLENLLFDFPGADVILRSCDSYEFRVLKLYIFHSSPILGEKLSLSINPQAEPAASPNPAELNVEGTATNALGVVQLPIEGAILFSLLTYIFPVPPILPPIVEQIMELLSIAQMYKMDVVLGLLLAHIRIHIAQQEPPLIQEENAFVVLSLAQEHGLRAETLQAARCTLSFSRLTIEDSAKEEKLDMMPGAIIRELWRYHQRVRSNLTLDLKGFIKSDAVAILGDLSCVLFNDSGLPSCQWLYRYLYSIGAGHAPAFLDLTDFHMELAVHIERRRSKGGCASCSAIPRDKIREFWRALTAVVHGSIAKAEPDFVLPVEATRSECQARPPEATSPPKYSDMPDADIILQSSDLVHFHVHKSALVASSPFFADMFSLPQPPNDATSDELPMVHLSEDAEVLDSLISMLYPVPPEISPTNDNILTLLSAAAKYDMDAVQSSIRAEVSCRGLLSSSGPGVFRVYAVAHSKGLIQEVEAAARLTLGRPLTFESLGDELRSRSFEGWALHDLAEFRLRSIQNFFSRWGSFSSPNCPGGFLKNWLGCPTANGLPTWLQDFLRLGPTGILAGRFTETIPTSVQLRDKYLKALQSHVEEKDCHFCMKVHAMKGETLCAMMEDISTQAWNVPISVSAERPGTP